MVQPFEKDGTEEEPPETPDFNKMPFHQALLEGWLTNQEYLVLITWFTFLFLIFLFGEVLASAMDVEYVGHLVWSSTYTALFTCLPIYQYFQRFEVTMLNMVEGGFAGVLHTISMAVLFGAGFNGDGNDVASLWILNAYLLYYLGVLVIIQFILWADAGFVIKDIDSDGDGKLSLMEVAQAVNTQPFVVGFGILFCFELFVWGEAYFATTFTIFFAGALLCVLVLLRNWALNDFYLDEQYQRMGGYFIRMLMAIFLLVAAFSSEVSIDYCLAGFFWLYMLEQVLSPL